ncbi:MAG: hypothetical protein AB7P69_22980 [Candidatus Binatia bacterium]
MSGIIGSVIFLIPGLVRPFLELEHQRQLDEFLSTVSITTFTWAVSILLFAVFIATFLAWKEEREGRELAEQASPEALRHELDAVRLEFAQQKATIWQPLTQKQQDTFFSLITDSEHFPLQERRVRIFALALLDCIDLAETICGIFQKAGWRVEAGHVREPNLYTHPGICVYYATGNAYADALMSALQKSLDCPFEAVWKHEEKEPPPGWPRFQTQYFPKLSDGYPDAVPPPPYELAIFVSRKPHTSL